MTAPLPHPRRWTGRIRLHGGPWSDRWVTLPAEDALLERLSFWHYVVELLLQEYPKRTPLKVIAASGDGPWPSMEPADGLARLLIIPLSAGPNKDR